MLSICYRKVKRCRAINPKVKTLSSPARNLIARRGRHLMPQRSEDYARCRHRGEELPNWWRRQATPSGTIWIPQDFFRSHTRRWFAFYDVIFAWPDNYCDMPIRSPQNGSQRPWRAFSAMPDIHSDQIRRRGAAAGGERAVPFNLKANRFGFTLTGHISQKLVFVTFREIE